MSNQVAEFLVDKLNGFVPPEVIILFISMLPVLELRGGLIAAKLLGVSFFKAFALCFLGNMVPIPFILLLMRYVLNLLKRNKWLRDKVERFEQAYKKKGEKVQKYSFWGLFMLVAIPLPGTGGWTGALVATVLDMRLKRSLPSITLGVITAGLIMSAVSYGLLGFFM